MKYIDYFRHCEERSNPEVTMLLVGTKQSSIKSYYFSDCFIPRNDGIHKFSQLNT